MKSGKGLSAIEELAASQWGLFTTAQAAHYGVQRNQISRLVEKGRAEKLCYGVYRMTSGDETAGAEIKAAWMSIYHKDFVAERMKKSPRDAVVAGRTAAFMHNFGDFYASPYTFIVSKRKQTTRDDMKYLLWELDEQDITFLNGLPVTTIERTIADLVRLREDPEHLNSVIADATRKGLSIDVERLAHLLSPLAARNGYPKNDGDAFASDLLSKNSAVIQLEQMGRQFQDMSKVFANSEAVKNMIESMGALSGALSKSIEIAGIKEANARLTMHKEKILSLFEAPKIMSSLLGAQKVINQYVPVLQERSEQINSIAKLISANSVQMGRGLLEKTGGKK